MAIEFVYLGIAAAVLLLIILLLRAASSRSAKRAPQTVQDRLRGAGVDVGERPPRRQRRPRPGREEREAAPAAKEAAAEPVEEGPESAETVLPHASERVDRAIRERSRV